MDFVKEAPAAGFSGAGPILLGGAAGQGDARFRDVLDTGAPVRYVMATLAASPTVKRQTVEGIFSTGSPDQLTVDRVLRSTNGGLAIDWLTSDRFVIYIAPLVDVLAPQMETWPTPIGAANGPAAPIGKNDNGSIFSLNVAAANRTFTIGTALSALPYLFRFGVYAHNHASQYADVVPHADDSINGASAGTSYHVVGNTGIRWFRKDPVRSAPGAGIWVLE